MSQRDTTSHNNTNMSQRAQGPQSKNEKTERREGEKGKKKKFLSTIPISNLEQRQARGEVESETLRDLPMARRRRSSCHGFVTTRSE